MKLQLLLFFIGILLSFQASGQYTSVDNHSGLWSESATWDGGMPGATDIGDKVNIFGFVEWDEPAETELAFKITGGGGDALVVKDTLIVYGDLSFANDNNLIIEEGGVLIVYGNLSATNKIEIAPGGYLVVQDDLDLNDQQAIADGDVENIFVGGNSPDGGDFTDVNDDSDIEDEDGGLDDFYEGKDPVNADYSINPDTTDICSRTNEEVTLYLSGGNNAYLIEHWQISTDGDTFSEIADTEDLTSYTVTSTETRYYRVKYIPEEGAGSSFSDTAVVYCESLCMMTVYIDEPESSTQCYSEDVSFDFTSTVNDGTSPYTYLWEISSPDDPAPENIATEPDNSSDQETYSNFPNPEAISWQYTVNLTVTDAEGCTATDSQTITLQRRPETGNTYHVPNEFDHQ